MPAEIFALANAFLFALHNLLTKKGLRTSTPGTAVKEPARDIARRITRRCSSARSCSDSTAMFPP